MKVVWRSEALKHLDDIFDYIAADNEQKAFQVWDAIYSCVDRQLVGLNESSGEFGRKGYRGTRELVVPKFNNYIVIYRIRSETVEVLAVRHSRRFYKRR